MRRLEIQRLKMPYKEGKHLKAIRRATIGRYIIYNRGKGDS
jgi:hypothetical protein